MKKGTIYIIGLLIMLLCSCDTEETLTCLKSTGTITETEYTLGTFDSIIVYERLQLVVKDAPDIRVRLKTGENLLEDFEIKVEDNTLSVRNTGACNITRDYDQSILYVSHPNLKQIRNSSGQTVVSDGILTWPSLNLVADDLIEEDFYHKDGDFRLELDANEVMIRCNGLSNFFLSGSVTSLDIQLLEGDSRLPLDNLNVLNAKVYHRGTNDIRIAPAQSITGELRSTGNLILLNTPGMVAVETYFTGSVIYE